MPRRLKNRIKFQLEKWMLRGAQYRLLVIGLMIGFVSLSGGLVAHWGGAGFGEEGEAIWWAFLRLTDPGYLGDDEGVFRRTLSTVLTVLGYVIFLGALIAIMTQWLNEKLRNLESGLTPIAQNGHILILGWTNRSAAIVRELLRSEGRVKRFLQRFANRKNLQIVIMAEDVTPQLMIDLEEEVGPDDWHPNRVIFRTGTPLRIEHLRRVDYANASAILLPGADFAYGGADQSDTRIVKTLLNIDNHGRAEAHQTMPLLTTELFDQRKVAVANATYSGELEVLASNAFIAQLMAQNVRHPGLSQVFGELLSHNDGSEVYVRTAPSLIGHTVDEVRPHFPSTVILGICRPSEDGFIPLLTPGEPQVIQDWDRLVFLAKSYEDCVPDTPQTAEPPEHTTRRPSLLTTRRKVLVVGWNHKVPAFLEELDSHHDEHFSVTSLSSLSQADRETDIRRDGIKLDRIETTWETGDSTVQTGYATVDLAGFDNVVFAASDRFATGEESDATTILRFLVFKEVLGGAPLPPTIVELMDPDNVPLLPPGVESIVSPVFLSHMLAQVALRRELHVVFDHLFGPEGADISLAPATCLIPAGRPVTFLEIQTAATANGLIALGVRLDGRFELNPDHRVGMTFKETDELILLASV